MKLRRSIKATLARPGNGPEQAYRDGWLSITKPHISKSQYAKHHPAAFKAGREAARKEVKS